MTARASCVNKVQLFLSMVQDIDNNTIMRLLMQFLKVNTVSSSKVKIYCKAYALTVSGHASSGAVLLVYTCGRVNVFLGSLEKATQ